MGKTVHLLAKHFAILLSLLCLELPHASGRGEIIQIESIGELCKAKQVLGGLVAVDPKDGRERLILTNDNEEKGCELLSIDFENDSAEMYVAPAGAGAWGIIKIPQNRFVVSTFYDGSFMTFDFKSKTFLNHNRLGEQTYIWTVALGSDGRIYGGSYPDAKLGAFDPDTGEIEDLGSPVQPNMYLRNTASTPAGQIICSFGNDAPGHSVYHPDTSEFHPLPGLEVTDGVSSPTVFGDLLFANVSGKGLVAWEGEDLNPALPESIPRIASSESLVPMPHISTKETLYMRSGSKVFRWKRGETEPKFLFERNLRGGTYRGVSEEGIFLGNRGQDYFLLRPPHYDIEMRPIPINARGRSPLFLKADPQGRVWGGPHFGQTLFHYDPKTKETVNTGAVCDLSGEIYDVTFLDGKTFAASYSGGDITVYDPDIPWDQWGLRNPKPLSNVRQEGYIRPTAGITVGKDGYLYSGWMARYGVYGGALVRTLPETGEQEVYVDPLGPRAIYSMDVLADRVYLGTSLSANGLGNATGPVSIGIWDTVKKKLIKQRYFEGPNQVGHIAAFPEGVVLSLGGVRLLILDAQTLETKVEIPLNGGGISNFRFHSNRKTGEVWLTRGKRVCLLSVGEGRLETVATLDRSLSNVTQDPQGNVYVSMGAEILRLMFD